jgi:hypothetical protein
MSFIEPNPDHVTIHQLWRFRSGDNLDIAVFAHMILCPECRSLLLECRGTEIVRDVEFDLKGTQPS